MLWVKLVADNLHAVPSPARSFEKDVPVACVRHRDASRQPTEEAPIVLCGPATSVGTEIGVVHHQDIRLMRTVHDERVAAVKILSRMNMRHRSLHRLST